MSLGERLNDGQSAAAPYNKNGCKTRLRPSSPFRYLRTPDFEGLASLR
jgi:hypothetical protein